MYIINFQTYNIYCLGVFRQSENFRTGGGYELNDDGEDSPRVVGKVTEGTETASDEVSGIDSEVTPDNASSASESRPLPIVVGTAVVTGVGVGGLFILKKKK